MSHEPYTIRGFRPDDAEACFRIRAEAFVKRFYAEIGPEGVVAGINAYLPSDYVRLAESSPTFVAVQEEVVIGFVTLCFVDDTTSRILFLYVRLDRTGEGIGSALVRFLEEYVRKEHPHIRQIVLNTAVPRYNQAFYERMGYVRRGESVCQYPDGPVTAIRLVKELRHARTGEGQTPYPAPGGAPPSNPDSGPSAVRSKRSLQGRGGLMEGKEGSSTEA